MSQTTTPTACTMTAVPATEVPPEARVVHFDQLGDAAKDRILSRDRGGEVTLGSTPAELDSGDVVVFTEYLRVTER
ncbi:hypothetical protein ACFQE1_16530 [Halobium palmae]|uniref:DUF7979 domain-containing protein n=1 Tax=Halobium palmae TaxID=1776492 RepID=A0ABD5S354_9EURY